MRHLLICIFLMYLMINCGAYTISQYTKTFYDASRNRNIQTVIFYPVNAANPSESFPYAIFGHGWLVSYSYTQDLTDAWVGLGWIVALPTTESGLFPSHQNFALDIVFLRGAVLSESSDPASPLYNKVIPLSVASGYSMGGGSAVLAASYDSGFDAVITYAAANTNPSAITAAASVYVPSLTLSGSSDNIAPPSSHQIPLYNNLASVYKSFVSLNGATHTNLFSQSLVPVIMSPFLSYLKTGSVYYLDVFEAVLASNTNSLTYQITDNLIVQLDPPNNLSINLDRDYLSISWERILEAHGYRVYAADHPYDTFEDITSLGTLSGTEVKTWDVPLSEAVKRFFYITSYRD